MSLPTYSDYLDTGVDWLQNVPGHWQVKPLWTMFKRIKRTGFVDEELLSVYRDHGVVPKSSRDDNNNKPSEYCGALINNPFEIISSFDKPAPDNTVNPSLP